MAREAGSRNGGDITQQLDGAVYGDDALHQNVQVVFVYGHYPSATWKILSALNGTYFWESAGRRVSFLAPRSRVVQSSGFILL